MYIQNFIFNRLLMNSYKKIASILFVLSFFVPIHELQAQETASINASAKVISGVVVEGIQALDFNNVLRGMTKTVNAEDAAVTVSGGVNPGANEEQAIFAVLAENGTNMTLEISFPSTVERTNADPIPITFTKEDNSNNFFWSPAVNISELATTTRNEFNTIDSSGDFPVATAEINDLNGVSLNAKGVTGNGILVAIGGTVSPALDQDRGIYVGIITLTATLND
jgi:hypothetical protein